MAASYGTAQSDGFILQEATLMLGEVGNALDLTVEENSIGLFKNLQFQNTRSFTDLTQGVRQGVVASAETENTTMVTGEGYEFTPRQLMFAMGQEGYKYVHTPSIVAKTVGDVLAASDTITVDAIAGITQDSWIVVRPTRGVDNGLAYRVVSVAGNVITLDRDLVEAVPANSDVYLSTMIRSSGSLDDSCASGTYFSMKVVSQKQNCLPIIVTSQKVRVSSGLQLSFGTSDWANIPYELKIMDLTPSDVGYAAWLADGANQYNVLTA